MAETANTNRENREVATNLALWLAEIKRSATALPTVETVITDAKRIYDWLTKGA
jgi:hypothetical protein